MQKIRIIIAALMLITPFAASAVPIVENVQLDFASGAQWNGTITFNEGYQGMIDTDGYLTGGLYGYNEYFGWTWWLGTGQTNPYDNNGDGYLNDWLMNGTDGGSYSMYIGLSWQGNTLSGGGLQFIDLDNPYYNGNSAYSDVITNHQIHNVPEPGTLALLCIGLAGMALTRRRKKV